MPSPALQQVFVLRTSANLLALRLFSQPLTLSDLIFGSRSTGTGPQAWTLRSSANAYGTDITLGTLSNNSAWSLQNAIDFSFAITAATTFRLFGYNGAGNPSASTANWRIDDLQLIYSTGRNLIWSPITGVWDLTVQNWTEVGIPGTPVAFQADDRTTFDDTGLANGSTVTIQAAGVTIGNTKVTNTTGTYTFSGGSISGTGSLTKSGAGKLILNSTNAYTGGTIVNEGTVSISADEHLGATTGGVLLSAAGTLQTTGSLTLNASRGLTGTGTINIAPATTLNVAGTVNTGALTLSNPGSLILSGTASAQIGGLNIQQAINLAANQPILLGGPLITTNTADTIIIGAQLGLGSVLRIFNIADGSATTDITLGSLTSTTAGGRLHKLGEGTLEFLGDNSGLLGGVRLGTAGATPVNGGTLIIHSATNLGPGGAGTSGQFQFNAGTLRATTPFQFPATLALSIGGSAPLISTFAGADVEFLGATSLFLTGAAPHIITTDSNIRFASVLTGSTAGLTVRGTGSLTLAAGGTFTGDVIVDAGRFFVIGNLGGALPADNHPAITIIGNGTLGGSVSGTDGLGSIIAGDATTIGTVSPGTATDSTATLAAIGTVSPATHALDILANGILAMEIGGVNLADYDQISATGTVSLAGTLNVSLLNGFTPTFGDTFTLILNDDIDLVVGEFTNKPEGSTFMASGHQFRINYAGNTGNDVILTSVPEPASAALLLGGLGLLGVRRRR